MNQLLIQSTNELNRLDRILGRLGVDPSQMRNVERKEQPQSKRMSLSSIDSGYFKIRSYLEQDQSSKGSSYNLSFFQRSKISPIKQFSSDLDRVRLTNKSLNGEISGVVVDDSTLFSHAKFDLSNLSSRGSERESTYYLNFSDKKMKKNQSKENKKEQVVFKNNQAVNPKKGKGLAKLVLNKKLPKKKKVAPAFNRRLQSLVESISDNRSKRESVESDDSEKMTKEQKIFNLRTRLDLILNKKKKKVEKPRQLSYKLKDTLNSVQQQHQIKINELKPHKASINKKKAQEGPVRFLGFEELDSIDTQLEEVKSKIIMNLNFKSKKEKYYPGESDFLFEIKEEHQT